MSSKLPIGVATIERPLIILSIIYILIFIISCTPINLSKQDTKNTQETTIPEKSIKTKIEKKVNKKTESKQDKQNKILDDIFLDKTIIALFAKDDDKKTTKQFLNTYELGIYNLGISDIVIQIEFFENEKDLKKIIEKNLLPGKIFLGPIQSKYAKFLNEYCTHEVIFFSYSSKSSLAKDCVYLINFFPQNELSQLMLYLNDDAKVALLYPENEYGYLINSLIDDIIFESPAILVNRSSYKDELTNVRDSIKELGKYELRKYELNRQKQILSSKKDEKSKTRLKKLERFKTTRDYDFTHILIADYGLNLLQVAPLLPYYDIDPNIVQFMGTGVIDDKTFFYEPSLQGAIFPGVPETKRINIINNYMEIYDDEFLRISTLPYDIIGLINFIYAKEYKVGDVIKLLNNPNKKFEGIDGNFYFKDNMIERDLSILRINNGNSFVIN
ncbi:hypothetical protein OA977_02390 [Pelagibacteraceae bacterium]|nr:hypothetical protein [Pelagibacteraceae bacterium]